MKKIFLILFLPALFFSQTKKEQIIILNGKIDSLKYENFNQSLKISELNSQNSELINSNSRLLKEKQSLTSENDSLRNNQKKYIAEKQILINKLKDLQDSLQNIQSQQSITKKKTDWELLELKGKVKSKTTSFWEGDPYAMKCQDEYESSNFDIFFNESGYITEEKRYSWDDPQKKQSYTIVKSVFDNYGNKLESRTIENGKLNGLSKYRNGKLFETIYYDNNKIYWSEAYYYDELGNKIEERGNNYAPNFTSSWEKKFKYDAIGNIIEIKYSDNGKQSYLIKYKIEYYNP